MAIEANRVNVDGSSLIREDGEDSLDTTQLLPMSQSRVLHQIIQNSNQIMIELHVYAMRKPKNIQQN